MMLTNVKCFEHFFEPSPNELAAKGILHIYCISNKRVITLNKFRKRARSCFVHRFLVY